MPSSCSTTAYPPDKQEAATHTVLQQAELFSDPWSRVDQRCARSIRSFGRCDRGIALVLEVQRKDAPYRRRFGLSDTNLPAVDPERPTPAARALAVAMGATQPAPRLCPKILAVLLRCTRALKRERQRFPRLPSYSMPSSVTADRSR
jgi:hypothetical protein